MIYQIIGCGNDRQPLFSDKEDFEKYLKICGCDWKEGCSSSKAKEGDTKKIVHIQKESMTILGCTVGF